jgi:putative oxidoreductase
MKILKIQQRIYGSILLILGLNGFLKFLPLPEQVGFAKEFMEMLVRVGYLMPVIACIQIFAGLTLLINRAVNWGLIILLPITFNIFAFHLMHDRAALIPAIIIFVINLIQIVARFRVLNKELYIINNL